MAEQEVAKHVKKIYKTWFDKELPVWHKVSEFLLEIIIIVFAVTISIWFHNRSEHAHEQEQVKEFMIGLKADLTHDLSEMNEDKKSYEMQHKVFNYLAGLKKSALPNRDSLEKYRNWLYNTTQLNPNDGRFQGFKSSGKLGNIENKTLENDILDLYEENIVMLLSSTRNYITNKRRFYNLISSKQQRFSDSTSNYLAIMASDEIWYLSGTLSYTGEVIERYDNCIRLMKKIIAEIDETYGNE